MPIGIGIDTGGTCTDAVLYDYDTRTILGSAKALTTRQDLSIGILNAIDALPNELTRCAELISLSTTLATNACVEEKGGRAKLIFFGGKKEIIDQYGAQYGLPRSEEIGLFDCATHFSGAIDREPDWERFRRELEQGYENLDGVGIIEMNAMRNGAVIEKKARDIIQETLDVPVVCGHELFSELNSLQRGATTLLNAGLFPVIGEFLSAVKKALAVRGICPKRLVILRSDGGLMSEDFAVLHPVETLLCGPAASAVGCVHMTDIPDSVMVDMGGTTTDIALIQGGRPVTFTEGVSIGKWKTFVNGLYIRTLGLGGDSAVHYKNGRLTLESGRVVPLCAAAHEYPCVLENLKKMPVRKHTRFLYEHYLLVRDISGIPAYTEQEKNFCRVLRSGPLPIEEAAAAVGKDIYSLDVSRLVRDGVVLLCGLTPTDIMHLCGDFQKYCTEASRLGAQWAACNLGVSVEELCRQVYDEVKRKLYLNIVVALLENQYPHYRKNGISPELERLIGEAYEAAGRGEMDSLLTPMFRTSFSLVGVGGPIRVFIHDVARMLGTHAVVPENYMVANALGAVMGSVSASCCVEIRPSMGVDGITGYTVFGSRDARSFETEEEAVAYAVSEAEAAAREEALRRGAVGEVKVTSRICTNSTQAGAGTVYLGTVVTACAEVS